MGIEAKHPPEALEVVQQALARPAKSPLWLASLFESKASGRFLSMPHRVAYLRLDEISPDSDLRKVTRISEWRFLVHDAVPFTLDGAASGASDLDLVGAATVDASSNEYIGLDEGPFVAATERAIRSAEGFEEVQNGHYEAILLSAPAVYVMALWLRDREGTADIVVPMPPVDGALAKYEKMRPAEFMRVLDRLAEAVRPR